MEIQIRNPKKTKKVSLHRLKQTAQRALEELRGSETWELSIILVGDEEIRQLNKAYRHIDKSTDVLSFPLQETNAPGSFKTHSEPFFPFPLGDVIISVDTAERQALAHHHSLGDEMDILLVHGILHLAGYDHEKKKEAKQMLAMEMQILKTREGLIKKSLSEIF
jgi:probable rRNA maturation factor